MAIKISRTKFAEYLTIITALIGMFFFTSKQLSSVINFFYYPLKFLMDYPSAKSPEIFLWLYIVGTIIWIELIIHIFKRLSLKKVKSETAIIGEDEIVSMMKAIDSQKDEVLKKETLSFMKEFDKSIQNIFTLNKNQYKPLWVVQDPNDETNVFVMSINGSVHTEEDEKVIKWALKQPNNRFTSTDVKDNFDGVNHEVVFARNLGDFKFGYVALINVPNIITDLNKKQFKTASSHFMLLGRIDKLCEIMVELTL
jgi:hypothetical protein